MVQEGLKCGVLVTWTKSFACPDGVGEDTVRMLEDAIARRGVSIIARASSTARHVDFHAGPQNSLLVMEKCGFAHFCYIYI